MPTKKDSPSRVLFVGPAGCGKSEKLLRIFEERLAVENPLEPLSYFIVPSQEHAERIIKILILRGSAGFFSNRITTLDDLIEKAFEIPNPPAASNLTKIAVVRRLLAEDCGVYFEAIRDKPGFLNLILNLITELKDHCWTAELFRKEMARLKKMEPDTALKYEALADIYERYEAALKQLGLRDRRDTLGIYLEQKKAQNLKPLAFHTLCFDGFFDFTPLQKECVAELVASSQNAAAALTWDAPRAGVFEPVSVTQKMFLQMGFAAVTVGTELPRYLEPELAHLSRVLFASLVKPNACRNEAVDWFEAPDPETEAEMIARRILVLLSEKQFRPSQIAILCRSVRAHRALFETVLRRFEIPFHVHERERLSESEWIQTAARLVRLFREDWKKEDWIGFLRSSFVLRFASAVKDERALHAFEGWCWKKGIRGGAAHWKAALETKSEKPDAGESAAAEFFSLFSKLEEEWKKTRTSAEWAAFFKRTLYRDFGMLESLRAQDDSAAFQHELHAPARFEKILDEMERAAGDEKEAQVNFDKFADDFLRLVELDLFSLPYLNQNAVQIYDVSLARQKEYEVVFVAGLAEKEFPQQIREEALLSDWERRLIQGAAASGVGLPAYALPERKSRQQLEKYLFYLAVTRARRHLCVSHARRDAEGKPVLRSFYLEEFAACFEKGLDPFIKKDTQPYPLFEEVRTEQDLRLATIGVLFNPWEPLPDEAFLNSLLGEAWKDPAARFSLTKALSESTAQLTDERVLARPPFHLNAPSATRLESFARCSYRYFSERILKLQVTEEDTRVRNQGSIMHGVLEDFFKGVWKNLTEEEVVTKIDELLQVWAPRYPLDLSPYQTDLALFEMKAILTRFLKRERERLQTTPFQPRYFEYEIPKEKPVTLEKAGLKMNVQGKIDRIDVNETDASFVISDYKRSKNFKKANLDKGTSLQLPLYLLAVSKLLSLKPLGGQLLNLKDHKNPTGFFNQAVEGPRDKMTDEEFDQALDRALRFSVRYLNELESGKIAVMPRDCADNCSFSSLCRIEKWKLPEIAEKIRAEDKKLGF